MKGFQELQGNSRRGGACLLARNYVMHNQHRRWKFPDRILMLNSVVTLSKDKKSNEPEVGFEVRGRPLEYWGGGAGVLGK